MRRIIRADSPTPRRFNPATSFTTNPLKSTMKTHHDILVRMLTEHSQALALPKGRRVGQPGHDVARDYLLRQMAGTLLVPFHGDSFELTYELPHPNTKALQKFTNLVGVIPGTDRTLPPILVGAHYDSVIDAPCVDDNATSVALNLSIAMEYAQRPLDRDLIIAFFDAEEPPFYLGVTMGSRRFCEDYCGGIRFAAVIITDLIGHDATDCELEIPGLVRTFMPRLKKLIAVMGAETNATFPGIVEAAANEARDLHVLSTLYAYVGPVSDHAAFSKAGHPFLFLSCGQGTHYHKPTDDLNWINFGKLARITRMIGDIVERIDGTPPNADRHPCDPFETEMRMLRRAIGPVLPLAMRYFGIPMPESREALDSLVEGILDGKLPRSGG